MGKWDDLDTEPKSETVESNTEKQVKRVPKPKTNQGEAFDGSPLPNQALPEISEATEELLESAMSDLENEEMPFIGCIFGNIGTGKTVGGMKILRGIIDPDKYILYIGTAQGWSSLKNHPELMVNVKRVYYENQEQLVAYAKAIKKGNGIFGKIGAVMFDEYTMMHDSDLYWIVKSRSMQRQKEKDFKDPHSPALPDYNSARIRSNEVLAEFMKTDMLHLMFICHERKTKLMETVPDFPDKAGKEFYRILHGVYFANAKNTKDGYVRELQLHSANRVTAKNRIGGLGGLATPDEIVSAYKVWGIPSKQTEKEINIPEDDLEAILAD